MASSLTLSLLRARVRSMLGDLGGADWSNERLDAGARLALEEYSRAGLQENAGVLARQIVATLTPDAGAREIALGALSPAVLRVDRVWYPYAAGGAPVWVSFDLWFDDGQPVLFLKGACGDGSAVARIFYRALHILDGLDGARASSFTPRDDSLLTLGAAGHACLQRAIELGNEAEPDRPGSGYGSAGRRWLADFRAGLKARPLIRLARWADEQAGAEYYDPNLLEWRSYEP